jgi:hypothetical protein
VAAAVPVQAAVAAAPTTNGKQNEKTEKLKSGALDRWDSNVVRKERYPHQFIGSFLHQFDDNNKPWDSTTVPLPLFVSGFARIIQANLNFTDEDLNDIVLLKDKLAEI